MAPLDDADAINSSLASDQESNAIENVPFVRDHNDHALSANDCNGVDDDELLQRAAGKIDEWKGAADLPSLTQVQTLFDELIRDGASNMLRDKVVDTVVMPLAKSSAESARSRARGLRSPGRMRRSARKSCATWVAAYKTCR